MRKSTALEVLVASIKFLRECSDWFPPLKSAAGGLSEIARVYQVEYRWFTQQLTYMSLGLQRQRNANDDNLGTHLQDCYFYLYASQGQQQPLHQTPGRSGQVRIPFKQPDGRYSLDSKALSKT